MFQTKQRLPKKQANPKNGASATPIQRKIGFEFEVGDWEVFKVKEGAEDLARDRNHPECRLPLAHKDVILSGEGFGMTGDASPGFTDIEYVTEPFEETDEGLERLRKTMAGITASATALHHLAQENPSELVRASSLGQYGDVKLPNSLIDATTPPLMKPQLTAGVGLRHIPDLLRLTGLSAREDEKTKSELSLFRKTLIDHKPGMHPLLKEEAYVSHHTTAFCASSLENILSTPPSPELVALASLIRVYILSAIRMPFYYPKSALAIMARTDFAQMFRLLPPQEQEALKAENASLFVKAMENCLPFINLNSPIFENGVRKEQKEAPNKTLERPLKKEWIRNIPLGVDLLTQKYFPMPEKASELDTIGSWHERTELLTDGTSAPIFELRRMANAETIEEWGAIAEMAFEAIRSLKRDKK
ncbi:hypothetical protein FUAX_36850 [Fulvitalea axinellae]|uniref:Uncharacterized protein n=1 Tax=Fulvitalea axinellae TaxID=1182444 RepID=A0AAU9CT45_9BACT|nr:hypothetical protein FUAX_36850 [Fulvitalea axinellae]